MTRPFESIRHLFGRVLGSNTATEDTGVHEFSTLGITSPEAPLATNGNGHAAVLAEENSAEIEVQTADTQRLPQVSPELLNGRNGDAGQHVVAHDEAADEFGDALLDLGGADGAKAFADDDPFLDVLDETTSHEDFFVETNAESPAHAEAPMLVEAFEDDQPEAVAPVFEESERWSVAAETVAVGESAPASVASPANLSDLSPEAIDAIAQRVVAQISEKVVKEVAWEVVPELAELLIKQKLEEK